MDTHPDLEPDARPAPVATDGERHRVKPLILASSAYVEMERIVLAARETVHMAFRIFDPRTKLRSEAALGKGLLTWADLLEERARAGVSVRVLIADFDPLMAADLHEIAAESARELNELTLRTRGGVAAVAARHGGELGAFWRALLWPLVRPRAVDAGIDRLWPPVALWPATHHMKLLVVDAAQMVVGGLDVNERRYDDPSHDRPAEQTWQDVSLGVEGPSARTADGFVRWLWDNELDRRARLPEGEGERAVKAPTEVLAKLSGGSVATRQAPAGPTDGDVRFHVTASLRRRSIFARGPDLKVATVMECAIAAIARADWFLYVENQFVRDRAVEAALARRMRAVPHLQLIMVVPAAPDEVAFASNRSNGQRHGEWRQWRILTNLQEEFGKRIGVFTLAGARAPRATEVDQERAVEGAHGIVYVHSKVLIVDDCLAMVSSANLNGRSLRMDTEAGVSWFHRTEVARFRQTLWSHHLHRDTPTEGDVLSPWVNASATPLGKPGGGFVARWDAQKAERFARRRFYIPGRYV